jgi:hypothetical protein
MTYKEAIELLNKYHEAGISDEDCAWEHVKENMLSSTATPHKSIQTWLHRCSKANGGGGREGFGNF